MVSNISVTVIKIVMIVIVCITMINYIDCYNALHYKNYIRLLYCVMSTI